MPISIPSRVEKVKCIKIKLPHYFMSERPSAPSTSKGIGRNVKTVVALVILAIIVILAAILFIRLIGTLWSATTLNAAAFLESDIVDGRIVEDEIRGYGSHLTVSLTSINDYMRVKIIVDGKTVYEGSNLYKLNYSYDMGPGYHITYVIVENPPELDKLGPTIHVSGKVSITP